MVSCFCVGVTLGVLQALPAQPVLPTEQGVTLGSEEDRGEPTW